MRNKLFLIRGVLLSTVIASLTAFAQQHTEPSGNTLLWEVTGKGLRKPSYLYGTMHSRQRAVFNFGKEVLAALDSCETFAAELKLDMASVMGARELLFLPEGTSLKNLLSPAQYDSVAALVQQKLGKDMSVFGRMMPFYLATLLQESHLMDGEMPYFLDQYLHEYAKSRGLVVQGIESLEEQGKAFNVLPLDKQLSLLVKYVRNYDPQKEADARKKPQLMDKYVAMDMEGLAKYIEEATQSAKGSSDMPFTEEQVEALITHRNQVMAQRIDSMIQQRSLFAAVGAAHLPGKGGIIELLRKQGYTVRPVPFRFDGKGYVDLATSETTDWVDYTDKKAGYRARFPKSPTSMERKEGDRTMHVAMSMGLTGDVFVVNHTPVDADLRARMNSPQAAQVMDKLLKERLESMAQAEVQDVQPFSAYGVEGRQVRIKLMGALEMMMDMRMFIVGDYMYTLVVMQPPAQYKRAHVGAFFEAFQPS